MIKLLIHRHFLGLVFCCVFPLQAFSQSYRPLTSLVSYEQFENLILHNVEKIRELRPVWSLDEDKKLYWAGGTVRSFLHWHYIKLQTHSFKEVWEMGVPDLADLQPAGGMDLDFVALKGLNPSVSEKLKEFKELDYISEDLFSELNKLGGPTIESIAIRPQKLIDTKNGLKSYYNGRLEFELVNDTIFRSLPEVQHGDYSRTVEALRYIRFLFNFPELKAPATEIEKIKTIGKLEYHFINREDRIVFLEIAVNKLNKSVLEPIDLALALQKFSLINILYKYNITFDFPLKFENDVWGPNSESFSQHEKKMLSKIINTGIKSKLRESYKKIKSCLYRLVGGER